VRYYAWSPKGKRRRRKREDSRPQSKIFPQEDDETSHDSQRGTVTARQQGHKISAFLCKYIPTSAWLNTFLLPFLIKRRIPPGAAGSSCVSHAHRYSGQTPIMDARGTARFLFFPHISFVPSTQAPLCPSPFACSPLWAPGIHRHDGI